MLSESNKVLLGLSQNLSKNTTEIDLKESNMKIIISLVSLKI